MMYTKISDSCQIPHLLDIYNKYFYSVRYGIFIEVGGYDGISFSNTWGLAEEGWRGVYYEPVNEFALKCAKVHYQNDVQVCESAVGDRNGYTKLYMGSFASINEDVARRDLYKYGMTLDNYVTVPICTLDKSLPDYSIPHGFDLLVVDVEGGELLVLAGFNLNIWHPKMIIIETCKDYPNPAWRFNARAIDDILTSHKYTEIYHDMANSIYVKQV